MAQVQQVNAVNHLRELAITRLFNQNTFNMAWDTWRQQIRNQIGNPPNVNNIIDLGDSLGDIFRSTGTAGRGQAELSGGGAAWESLVCWYMNLCLIGSRTVVLKYTKQLVPTPIANAIAVMYGTFSSNSESDLIAIVFPNVNEVNNELEMEIQTSVVNFKTFLDTIIEENLDRVGVGIIQCKTNWNDNSQIPMLWDMVYRAQQFRDQNISVGREGYSIADLRDFTYAFVTVPTSGGPFRPNGTPVNRVRNLSGGNYWGRPTEQNVANSIKEIFQRNFADGQNNGLRTDLRNELQNLGTDYAYFRL